MEIVGGSAAPVAGSAVFRGDSAKALMPQIWASIRVKLGKIGNAGS